MFFSLCSTLSVSCLLKRKKQHNSLLKVFSSIKKIHSRNKVLQQYSMYSVFYLLNYWFFFLILALNLWGLMPLVGSFTGDIVFVKILALWGWGRVMISSLFVSLFLFVSNFIPSSPLFIMPFLSLIEVVSYFIRPLTLSLRLSINITTGHVLLWLLRKAILYLFLRNKVFLLLLGPISIVIFFYEFCIGIIQSLVFSLLLKSYLGEHK